MQPACAGYVSLRMQMTAEDLQLDRLWREAFGQPLPILGLLTSSGRSSRRRAERLQTVNPHTGRHRLRLAAKPMAAFDPLRTLRLASKMVG